MNTILQQHDRPFTQMLNKWTQHLCLIIFSIFVSGCGNTLINVKDPFHANIGLGMNPGMQYSNFEITVPAGKRLVIESITARTTVPDGQHVILHLTTTTSGRDAIHYIALKDQGAFPTFHPFVATATIRIYADAETTIRFSAQRSNGTGVANVNVVISGQYLSMP